MISTNRFKSGYLLLEDGTCFPGEVLIGSNPAFGEAVFNTSHSGYQEILTDPSYHRQIIIFTTPHIGNVGVNAGDSESDRIYGAGAVIRNVSPRPSNWRGEQDLMTWMESGGAPLLIGADTRSLTRHIRDRGAMRAGLFPGEVPRPAALDQVKTSPSIVNADLAAQVTSLSPYGVDASLLDSRWHPVDGEYPALRVAVLDFGVKRNILRELVRRQCAVIVLPANTSADDIIAQKFDGVLLSNGPGDPAAVTYGIETIRNLIGKLPLFGICLGHQLLALAAGLKTFKLPFGHRGANHPVRRERDQVVEITSQNHGFAVRADDPGKQWRVTHLNLNDFTVEGLEHADLPVFSVQYHPEASPGPHDSLNYFDRFIQEMQHAPAK
jgi:carbamoyl-phosphate synthase small subunit